MCPLSRSSTTNRRLGRPPGGFSLLELLVATAVFVGLALILVSIAASLSSFWQMGIAHNERRSSALSAFSRMARDLRFATLPPDPSATNFQFVINPASVGTNYSLPQSVFWQAPVASDRSNGNMALVGYFVQWVSETNSRPAPKLCRLVVDSNYSMQKPSDFVSDKLIASSAPATKDSGYAGQLAENVLGLWLQPLDQRKNPILTNAKAQAFPNGQFDSTKGYTVTLTNAPGTLVFPSALPASLEVALVAVDARTAKRLLGRPAEKPGAATSDMWNDVNTFYSNLPQEIKQGARIYSTVIDLQSAPR
ncbi:MAG: prepilin-type N-terminal cleavage/methylation domain-containing protein [Terrimicrobiaceae bacterium]